MHSLRSIRGLKRTKAYESLADVRPTVRNKPAGLVNTWYDITTTPSPCQTAPPSHNFSYNQHVNIPTTPSPLPSHGYSSQHLLRPASWSHVDEDVPMTQLAEPLFPQQPSIAADFPTVSPPFQHHSSPLPLGAPDNMIWASIPFPVHHESMMSGVEQVKFSLSYLAIPKTDSHQTACLPRARTDEDGTKYVAEIQNLPDPIRLGFRNTYIRRVIKRVFTSSTPWINPPIDVLQQEFNTAYPSYNIKLHPDDAATAPVCVFPSAPLSKGTYSTICRQSAISVFYVVRLGKKL